MGALKGNLASIKGMKQAIRALPVTVAADISKRAAPALTDLTQTAFNSNATVYNESRPAGVNGNSLSLVKSGATRDALRFVSVGTIVRCVLPTKWAKYLIGRYGILPNGALPVKWSARLKEIVAETKVTP
jgi:hypothetical protein